MSAFIVDQNLDGFQGVGGGVIDTTPVREPRWPGDDGFVSDYSPFSDEFIVRTQRFADGQQEVVSFSVSVRRRLQELRLRPRAARGERAAVEDETEADVSTKADKALRTSMERSRRMIRKRCKQIGVDRMLTLTTRTNETRIEVWAAWWDEFRRRINKVQDFQYVAVPERHQRGGWHMHIAVRGRQNWNLIRSVWNSVISKSGTDGAVNDSAGRKGGLMRKFGGKGRGMRHRIATYIAKYVGKGDNNLGFNKKRYWSSKGIVLPETTTYAHLGAELGRGDAIQAAYDCVDANGADFENAQLFWNRGIGVFWMATGDIESCVNS